MLLLTSVSMFQFQNSLLLEFFLLPVLIFISSYSFKYLHILATCCIKIGDVIVRPNSMKKLMVVCFP